MCNAKYVSSQKVDMHTIEKVIGILSVSNCIRILNCWCTVFVFIESPIAKVLTDILSKYYVQQGLNSEPVKYMWRQYCDVKFGCGSSAAGGGGGDILLWK